MSIVTAVILERSHMPTPDAWQAALAAAGFPVRLDLDFVPLEFDGFLPASYDGRTGGFEYVLSDLDLSEYEPEVAVRFGDRDAIVSLVTHSDFTELLTAVLAAAALAHLVGGILHDTESDELHDADAALAWARKMESDILPELA